MLLVCSMHGDDDDRVEFVECNIRFQRRYHVLWDFNWESIVSCDTYVSSIDVLTNTLHYSFQFR
jgi:hypothetical protein